MKGVLLVTIGFSPNIGGIESHFDNLVEALNKRSWRVNVLTYKPITTKVAAKTFEKRGKLTRIYRIPWFRGIFYKLVNNPLLEFLFLVPGLFIALPFMLLFVNPTVIHSHGLVAGFVSVFWGKLFRKRVITTTHSIYGFPKKGMYRNFAKWVFNSSDEILTLSKQSKSEIAQLGIPESKITVFRYWIDLNNFKIIKNAKKKTGLTGYFVLFVGRLVPEKGVLDLLEAAKNWDKNISLAIAGTGPLESVVAKAVEENAQVKYLGKLSQSELPLYYSAADVLIVPSTHEEGFGRVILEALACGTPIIGSNRGAIPEALDTTVGELVDVSKDNLIKAVERMYHKSAQLSKNTRKFAVERYSESNVETIINVYEKQT